MKNLNAVPWHQYAVVSYVASKASNGLGKTAMQKLVYLLEELGGVPAGYRFHFQTYGPYSADLSADLTYVESLGGIALDYDPALNIHNIREGRKATLLIGKAKPFFDAYAKDMDRILDEFSARRSRELELLAAIVYAYKLMEAEGGRQENRLVEQVRELKPRFSSAEIEAGVTELIARHLLKQ